MKQVYISMLIWLGCCLAACTTREERRVEETLVFAGENRAELEQVLEYYKHDELKLRAARFLIANMREKFAYVLSEADSVRQALRDTWADKKEVVQKWKRISRETLPKRYDAQIMTADYLIENIDIAFETWQEVPWGKYYSFEDFCKYILPYRIADEPLERWRKVYKARFLPLLDSIYTGTDVVEAAAKIMEHPIVRTGYKYSADFNLPHHGALFLLECRVGTCHEYCDFVLYLLRALGIPSAIDQYKYSPEVRHSHVWNMLKDTTGATIPIEYNKAEVKRDWKNWRRKGKVYRSFFDQAEIPAYDGDFYLCDVTEEYFGNNSVSFPVQRKGDGFLAMYAFEGWMPIARYAAKGKYGIVQNIEPDVIYMPVGRNGERWIENGYCFMPDGKEVRVFEPDTVCRLKVRLNRKYPITVHQKNHLYGMNGMRLEGCNRKDFVNAEILAVLNDSTLDLTRYIKMHSASAYRYIRICSPLKRRLEIAEMEFYTDTLGMEKVDFRVVEEAVPEAKGTQFGIEKAWDNDRLSFYQSYKSEVELLFDLGASVRLGGMKFTPRNDDNFVTKGEVYELLYQNGTEGWVSLGRKMADDDFVEFDGVPGNAVLRLHNCTKGIEEQIFLWEGGKQYFLGHLR